MRRGSCGRRWREASMTIRSEQAKAAWIEIRRRETELTSDRDRADFAVIRSGYAGAYTRAKKKKQLDTFLSVSEAIARFRGQKRVCALTGQPFDATQLHPGKTLKSPKRASLDCRNPQQGYTFANTRWTWAIANMARNEWPDHIFIEMCREVVVIADRRK